jgi:hypothetical protein
VLEAPGQARIEATIEDISRGGVALAVSWPGASGSEVMVALPGTTALIQARVLRSEGGHLALSFRQGQAALADVDKALAMIGGEPIRQAA